MAKPITDEEIEHVDGLIRRHGAVAELAERLVERIRADAAKIAELWHRAHNFEEMARKFAVEKKAEIEKRDATIARLRAVARAAQRLAFDMPGVTVVEGERDFDAALSALQPGDLGDNEENL